MRAGVDIWCEVDYKSDALWSERGGREWWTGSVLWWCQDEGISGGSTTEGDSQEGGQEGEGSKA